MDGVAQGVCVSVGVGVQSSIINHQPSTINRQSCTTINHQPSSIMTYPGKIAAGFLAQMYAMNNLCSTFKDWQRRTACSNAAREAGCVVNRTRILYGCVPGTVVDDDDDDDDGAAAAVDMFV